MQHVAEGEFNYWIIDRLYDISCKMTSADFNEALKNYYDKHFPVQLIYNWLNYKDGKLYLA